MFHRMRTPQERRNVLLLGSALGPNVSSIRYFSWEFLVARGWVGEGPSKTASRWLEWKVPEKCHHILFCFKNHLLVQTRRTQGLWATQQFFTIFFLLEKIP